jgi:hypothetical protein
MNFAFGGSIRNRQMFRASSPPRPIRTNEHFDEGWTLLQIRTDYDETFCKSRYTDTLGKMPLKRRLKNT